MSKKIWYFILVHLIKKLKLIIEEIWTSLQVGRETQFKV